VYRGWKKIKSIYQVCIEKIKMQVRSKYIFERTLGFNINIQPRKEETVSPTAENVWVCRKIEENKEKGRNPPPPPKKEKINVYQKPSCKCSLK
jgi:hypothetical protein